MTFEEYLVALQYISEEGFGHKARQQEAALDQTDAASRKQLGVVNG